MNVAVFDIETSGLALESTVYSNAVKLNDEPTQCYTQYYLDGSAGSLRAAQALLESVDLVVGFNSIAYDSKLLEHQFGFKPKAQLDLMILAKIMFTKDQLMDIDAGIYGMPKDLWGQFSLAAFGYRFGEDHKIEFSDWSRLSSEMMTYNIRDVDLTYRLYKFLIAQPNYPEQHVIDLEQDVASIIADQSRYGFQFNLEKARELNTRMMFRRLQLEQSLSKVFRPVLVADGPVKSPAKPIRRKVWRENTSYVGAW